MKLSNLKRANNIDVRNYLRKRYKLTDYQFHKMFEDDFPSGSGFIVFKHEVVENGGFLWRLTLPLLIPYYITIAIYVFVKWLIKGDRYLDENKRLLKFHRSWMRKLGIKWM